MREVRGRNNMIKTLINFYVNLYRNHPLSKPFFKINKLILTKTCLIERKFNSHINLRQSVLVNHFYKVLNIYFLLKDTAKFILLLLKLLDVFRKLLRHKIKNDFNQKKCLFEKLSNLRSF